MNFFFLTQYRRLAILGSVFILLLAAVIFYFRYETVKNSVAANLEQAANISLVTLNSNQLETLTGSEADAQAPEYLRLREQLEALEKVYAPAGIKGFYIMRMKEEGVIFLADSAPLDDPWHSEPGVAYAEAPGAIFVVASAGQGQLVGPYKDEYGSFYSYFAPIKNSEGKTVAIMGIDTEVSFFRKLIWGALTTPLIIIVFCLPLYILTILSLSRKVQAVYFKKQSEDLEHGVLAKTAEANAYYKNLNEAQAELEHYRKLTASRDIEIADLKKQLTSKK
jgi:methyl-accepting chemotaxis protein